MKKRLDVIMTQRGLAVSREKAAVLIKSGCVNVDGIIIKKPAALVETEGALISVEDSVLRYVGRGGLKLEGALEKWDIKLEGKVCIDIGASTGGFTDCMLQNGAARVYAVDVGKDQIAPKLKEDARVICMEQTNFRYVTAGDIGEKADFAAADVSFISLTKILVPALNLLKPSGEMVCLIKPQFEAGREKVGKNGVVRDAKTHREVIAGIVDFADAAGFEVKDIAPSPIRGGQGNIEYLLYLKKGCDMPDKTEGMADALQEEPSGCFKGDAGALSCSGPWRQRIARAVEASRSEL